MYSEGPDFLKIWWVEQQYKFFFIVTGRLWLLIRLEDLGGQEAIHEFASYLSIVLGEGERRMTPCPPSVPPDLSVLFDLFSVSWQEVSMRINYVSSFPLIHKKTAWKLKAMPIIVHPNSKVINPKNYLRFAHCSISTKKWNNVKVKQL